MGKFKVYFPCGDDVLYMEQKGSIILVNSSSIKS